MNEKKSFMDSVKGIFKKGNQEPSERRKHPRKNKTYIGEVEARGRKFVITVNNLSKEGMGITLCEKLEIDSVVNVTLLHEFAFGAFAGEEISLTLPARAVWIKRQAAGDVLKTGNGQEKETGLCADFDTGLKIEDLSMALRRQYDSLLEKLEDEKKEEEKN